MRTLPHRPTTLDRHILRAFGAYVVRGTGAQNMEIAIQYTEFGPPEDSPSLKLETYIVQNRPFFILWTMATFISFGG